MRACCVVWVIVAACGAKPASPTPTAVSPCGPPLATPPTVARQVVQRWQAGEIEAIAFSDDGRFLATASSNGSTFVWDVKARALVHTLSTGVAAKSDVSSLGHFVVWDGNERVVAGDVERGARVFEVASERSIGAFEPPLIARPTRLRTRDSVAWLGFANDARPKVSTLVRYDARRTRTRSTDWDLETFAAARDGKAIVASTPDGVRTWALDDAGTWDAPKLLAFPLIDERDEVGTLPNDRIGGIAALPDRRGAVVGRWRCCRPRQSSTDIDGPEVLLFTADGKVESLPGLAPGHGNQVWDVAVSDDGAFAAATFNGEIVVWDLATRRVRWRTTAFAGHVAFAPVGHAVAIAWRREIRVFDRRTGRVLATLGAGLLHPNSIALASPDKSIVASGAHVSTWSITSARRLDERAMTIPDLIAVSAIDDDMTVLRSRLLHDSWTVDTRNFDASCPPGQGQVLVERWRARDGSSYPPSTVNRTSYCVNPDGPYVLEDVDAARGRILFTTLEQFIEDEDLMEHYVHTLATGTTAVIKAEYDEVALSRDGSAVTAFLSGAGRSSVRIYDVTTGALEAEFPASKSYEIGDGARLVAVTAKAVAVGDGRAIRIYSRASRAQQFRVPLPDDATSIAATHDAWVVGMSDGSLALVRDGRVAWTTGKGPSIDRISVAADGSRATTTSADDAVRLWDLRAGVQLGTMLEFDDDEWIAATPNGAYTGTSEAAERIGWVFAAPSEYFRFEQFSNTFHDPAAVAARFGRTAPDVGSPIRRPPTVELVTEPGQVATSSTTLSLRVSSPTRVDVVRAYVEGRPVAEAKVCRQSAELALPVTLTGGTNRVSVVAVDDLGYASNATTTDIVSTKSRSQPELWIVAIGVDKYPRLAAKWQLAAAVADATSIAETFARQAGPGKQFGRAHVVTLFDNAVTVASVGDALDRLRAMRPDDVAIVFLAGHGWKSKARNDMVFLTGGVADPANTSAAIGWNEIGARLRRVPGRVVVLLDACHAGHISQDLVVPNGQLAAALHASGRAGVLVFAAAKGRQLSYELGGGARGLKLVAGSKAPVAIDGRHGLFTAAILRALEDSTTDRDGDGTIQMSELVEAATSHTIAASVGQQTPWLARREMFGDFGIAKAR